MQVFTCAPVCPTGSWTEDADVYESVRLDLSRLLCSYVDLEDCDFRPSRSVGKFVLVRSIDKSNC